MTMTAEEIEGAQMAAVALLGKIDRLEAENARMKETIARIKVVASDPGFPYQVVAEIREIIKKVQEK